MGKKIQAETKPKAYGYVIVEIEYNYNDEYYTTTEDEAGTPVKMFFDEKRATSRARDLNVNHILSQNIELRDYDYGGGLQELIAYARSTDDFLTRLADIMGTDAFIETFELNRKQFDAAKAGTGKSLSDLVDEDTILDTGLNYLVTTQEQAAALFDLLTLAWYRVERVEVDDDESDVGQGGQGDQALRTV